MPYVYKGEIRCYGILFYLVLIFHKIIAICDMYILYFFGTLAVVFLKRHF